MFASSSLSIIFEEYIKESIDDISVEFSITKDRRSLFVVSISPISVAPYRASALRARDRVTRASMRLGKKKRVADAGQAVAEVCEGL